MNSAPPTPPLSILRGHPLRALNTFGVDAKAAAYLRIRSAGQLSALRADPALCALPRLVLGGGSNLLLLGDVDGLVLHMDMRGIGVVGGDAEDPEDSSNGGNGGKVLVRAAAGESWHGLVEWTLARGLGGLENLALIPGTVGAAPIQNIGAYGAELKDCFHSLTAFDFASGATVEMDAAACRFGYRDSVFKHGAGRDLVILEVRLALPKRWRPNLGYKELALALEEGNPAIGVARGGGLTPAAVGAAVCALRRAKLPDPAQIGNAGSFFKNPVVGAERHAALLAAHPRLVSYPQADGTHKLAAGWLIDQCGWKGKSLGAAGVYEKQALVLVNRGGASGVEIARLAEAVRADVARRFGVTLEPEPVCVGGDGLQSAPRMAG